MFAEARPCTEAQRVAEAVEKDGTLSNSTKKFANVGCHGRYPNNVERDYHRYIRKQGLNAGLEPYFVDCQIKNKSGVPTDGRVPLLLPHETVHTLYTLDPLDFHDRFVCDEDALEEYWARQSQTPWCLGHPSRQTILESPRRCVPLRLHGDDAPCGKAGSILVIQFTSCMCRLSSWLSRWLTICIKQEIVVKNETLEALYKALVWSFAALASGTMPSEDHLGRPFTKGLRKDYAGKAICGHYLLLFCQLLGDLKWLKEEFRFKHFYNRNECCFFCRAIKTGNGYYNAFDYRLNCNWIGALRTTLEYLMQHDKSELCNLPGWDLSGLAIDLMHVILLGILQIAIGGVLWEFAFEDCIWQADWLPGGWKINGALRLKLAYQDFLTWARGKKLSCSQPVFTIGRLSMESLTSSACFKSKAGNTMKVGYWLTERAVARADANPHNLHLACIAGMMHGYSEIFCVCQQSGQFLSDHQAQRLAAARESALFCNGALTSEAMVLGRPHFRPKPKHHLCDHALRRAIATRENPAWHWCFSDEYFIGRVEKLAQGCHVNSLSQRVLQRYVVRIVALSKERSLDLRRARA